MRKKIAAGNWKMNTSLAEANSLMAEVMQLLQQKDRSDVLKIIAPPFPYLFPLSEKTKGPTGIKLAAQNCHTDAKGAYTGEVAVNMIKSVGATHVIIGHSERRTYFKESHEQLKKKVDLSLLEGVTPIFCIGETLEEREKNIHFQLVEKQLRESVFHLSAQQFATIILAYEPVWAIGTGVTASTAQAQEMHRYIRSLISKHYDAATADATSILYGGSCNAANARELFACPDVDGGLIGGASLKAADFVQIVHSF